MKIDFSTVLVDLDGKPLQNAEGKNMTLRSACIEVLMAIFNDEQDLSGEDKMKRYSLGLAIHATKDPVDVKAEDVALLKKLVGKGYGPMVSGQVWRLLDA